MSAGKLAPNILHLHSSFDPGGKEVRCARLINALGREFDHAIVSGDPQRMGAAALINRGVNVVWPQVPPLSGKPTPNRLKRLADAMAGYDLICTYNWGALDAVMAHTLFADLCKLPPLVHHEDGFNEDEADGLKWRRTMYRRIALGRTAALVVPSKNLERIALGTWAQPRSRVQLIANGIDTAAYAHLPRADAMPRLIKRRGEKWVGTLAGLRKVKDLPLLVRAFAPLPDEWQLVILGEGPEREAIRDEALRLNVAHRVHLPGFVADPAKVIGLFDLFALSSHSEQFPISVVEAMAAGLAVASTDVGDVRGMIAPANREFVTPAGDEAALAASLARLAGDAGLRDMIGSANRARARADYDEAAMIAAYRDVYGRAMELERFP